MKYEPPLKDYFHAKSNGDKWHLICKKCAVGWSLPKNNKHPGNLLYLLNHARGHEKPDK